MGDLKIGYCCNVHGGTTLQEVKSNLERFACEVKRKVSPESLMPVGLWLSESALAEMATGDSRASATKDFADWLAEKGLDPFTVNGFPQGNFHQDVVKHDVYLPTWASAERLEYTKSLATVHSALLERCGSAGLQTISTLPLGWPSSIPKSERLTNGAGFLKQCADNLRSLVQFLADVRQRKGNHVMVCLEPEPGCVLGTCAEMVRFFNEYLLASEDSAGCDTILEHLGICHDVCHSAVMFEDQETAVAAYSDAGIRIGKVQVSSAVKVVFGEEEVAQRQRKQLASFAEARYLHQTSVRTGGETWFYEDLSMALDRERSLDAQWRVHFHVPIFLDSLDDLSSTQDEIPAFLDAVKKHGLDIPHFEIETYAWSVLPQLRQGVTEDLASGIAEEIRWFRNQVSVCENH